MFDKFAGYATDIRNWERRLKEMDSKKVNPTKVKEIQDVITNLKSLLKEKLEKKEQRKKLKEQKVQEVVKESDAKVEDGTVVMPKKEFVEEHEKLVKELKPMVEEHKEQGAELKEVKEAAPTFKLDDKVQPIRGEESTGRVMRWDGKSSDLVYVAWDSGPLAERDGFGGYYPNDLKLHVEEQPIEAAVAPVCQECVNTKEIHGDLKSNYYALLKDLKDELEEAKQKHDHVWISRLEQKVQEMEEKIKEKYGNEKEGGAQNATELTILDHTPPRANSGPDAGGRDSFDEFQDEVAMPAGTEVTSAKGVPGSLFNAETAQHVANQLNQFINAPYKHAQVSALGGADHVSIILTVSADPKDQWANGILHNSRYGMFHIFNDGEIEHFSGSFNRINEPRMNFRKRNVKNVEQLVAVINEHLAKVNSAAPKQASIKTASISLQVFNKQWSATPVTKEGKLSYEITDNSGKKVLNIKPLNGQEMNAEHLKWAIQRELTAGYKQAKLTERIAMLPEGTKVYVLAQDKVKKRVKIASLEQSVRAWVPEAKIKLIALESQAVQHNGHSDKVLGQTATETLLDCVEGGPVWVSSTELLDANRPPATPESLNDLESAIKCSTCGSNLKNDATGLPEKGDKFCEKCNKAVFITPKKEALKTALPPTIPNQDAYLNDPVEKESAGCDQCNASMINGVFCHETGCPNARKQRDQEDMEMEGSVNKKADAVIDTDELELYTENERDLHDDFMATVDMIKEMLRNGTYDQKQALTYWVEWYTKGANKYELEFPDYVVPTAVIYEAARNQESYMKTVVESGEYGDVEVPAQNGRDINKLPVMDVEQEKDTLLDQLAKETDPEKKKSLERRYKHLSMASLNKKARVVHHKDGWHVLSEKGKNLGGPYKSKGEAVKRLRQVEYFKHHGSLRPFSKKAEVMVDPYQSLTDHITDMKSRMSQVQERLQSNPVPKIAGETDNSTIDLPELLEDLTMGIDLLETKLGGEDIDPELHANIEELENLLWTVEEQVGITPKLSEEEKAEPEHKEIVEELEKEAALPTAITPTLSNPAPAANAVPSTTDDKKTSCALCGGMMFNDYAAYQQHMEYTHKSNTMPTSPTQKLEPTNVTGKKEAASVMPTTVPSVQNVQPTDDDNLEVPVVAPTSPLPPGQKWVFDTQFNKYVAMPDSSQPGKTI